MIAERIASLAGLFRSLAIYRALPWRRRALQRFYTSVLTPGTLVFDIGAHVGSRTKTLINIGMSCVAVEPQPLFLRLLQQSFDNHPQVTVIGKAVGREPGQATLNISRRHPTVSTLSSDWIGTVKDTRGFEHVRWDEQVNVEVTTLDALIERHGHPDFCKIDVEGLEHEILCGLSQPIRLIAFEFLPAALPVALDCVTRLQSLADYQFNLTTGEQHHFLLDEWVDAAAIVTLLNERTGSGLSGDVYARLV